MVNFLHTFKTFVTNHYPIAAILVLLGAIFLTISSALHQQQHNSKASTIAALPPGATLPSEEQCASQVVKTPERLAENQQANATNVYASGYRLSGSLLGQYGAQYEGKVTGNFTGTTDEILQWGACKWGFDADTSRAIAVGLSKLKQTALADCNNQGQIQPETNGCQSVGIMRVKSATIPSTHPGTWPYAKTSTAFNVDYALASIRACYDGKQTSLGAGYTAGDEAGCIGAWYSGAWHDGSAKAFMLGIQDIKTNKEWETLGASEASPSSAITPSFYPLAPCPTCTSPSENPTVSETVAPSDTEPDPTSITAPDTADPCEVNISVAHNRKQSKHKHHDGDISGFMEALLKFFIELLNLLLKLFGGGQINVPELEPEIEPRNPIPCTPETTPQPEVTNAPVEPSTSTVPSLTITPSTTILSPAPSSAPGNIPVGSNVIFVGDYNTGNLSQWSTCQWKGQNSSCSGYSGQDYMVKLVNDGPGHETAARYEVRPGDEPDFGGERAEVTAPNIADVKEGDERWYEFSLKFPSDFPDPTGQWFIVMQWHAGGGSPPLSILIEDGSMLKFSNERTNKSTAIGPIQKGKWVNYVLHVKFSSGSNALAESWVDGVKQPAIHREPNMASESNYLKQGIYRGDQSLTHVVFHDGLRITAP